MIIEGHRDRFRDFLVRQNQYWELSAANYRGLAHVLERSFVIDGFPVKVQFNPERMRSSAAKVDEASNAARKCFLCEVNRPLEQESLDLGHDFLLLVNPFPIFNFHFTIPSRHHTPQLLIDEMDHLLEIAAQLEGYTVFYNGPECGASAPDHLHFQAGENGFLPIEADFEVLRQTQESCLLRSDSLSIWSFESYSRRLFSFETTDLKRGSAAIRAILLQFGTIQPNKTEPMVNLLCRHEKGKWVIHLFPRKLHRPTQFFEQGDKQLLISPASVDFGGVLITPRREDFEKITANDIRDIFQQVTLDESAFQQLKVSIQKLALQWNIQN